MFRTRFAPSPSGPLHIGHAYSALLAHDMAQAQDGQFLLRIEDIDTGRSRPEWEELIYQDLRWLGVDWDGAVVRQSQRHKAYDTAIDRLWELGLVYVCSCSRKDIRNAISAPHIGSNADIYPGTCRDKDATAARSVSRTKGATLRLNLRKALDVLSQQSLGYAENGPTTDADAARVSINADALIDGIGDVVLARGDIGTSYHLSVVVDDAFQDISHVIRGEDLIPVTPVHVILQRVLGLPTPIYHHHRLICDDQGKRLAKRNDARSISSYRENGVTPGDVRRMVGLGG